MKETPIKCAVLPDELYNLREIILKRIELVPRNEEKIYIGGRITNAVEIYKKSIFI